MSNKVHVSEEEDKCVFKRGNIFHFRYSSGGRQIRGSLKTSDPEEARRRFRLQKQRIPSDPTENLTYLLVS